METRNKNYCIILAGGVGRRLWPASQKELPKQFIDFFGTGRTLLQQTFDRFARFIPTNHIYTPAAGFYTTPGAGRNQVRIAYVLNKADLQRALIVLRKAIEAYPGREV